MARIGIRRAKRNPRRANGSRRTSNRNRLRLEGRPCWICRAFGRTGAIDYSLPSGHPMSFEVDELVPVSRYWEGGYQSAEQCASDYANLDAAHRCCNQWRSNKSVAEVLALAESMRHGPQEPQEHHDARELPLPQPWEL